MTIAIATDPVEYIDENNRLQRHQIRVLEGRTTRIARIHLLPGNYVIQAKGIVSLDINYEGPGTTAMLRIQEGNTVTNDTPSDNGDASLFPGRDGNWPVNYATIPLLLALRIAKPTYFTLWASGTNNVTFTVSSYQLVAIGMDMVWYGGTPYSAGPGSAITELIRRLFK